MNNYNWKKLQSKKISKVDPVEKKLNHLKRVISDPDGYNTNLASKDRIKSLEQQIEEKSEEINDLYHSVLIDKVKYNQNLYMDYDRKEMFNIFLKQFRWE